MNQDNLSMALEEKHEQFLIDNIALLNVSVPRYTSYPTANVWGDVHSREYEVALENLPKDESISLYVHIPFCHSMCLYCGCSVVLNRDPAKEERYVQGLISEIERVVGFLKTQRNVIQIHFGGGTPTKLSSHLLKKIIDFLRHAFNVLPEAEIAIEIDPRSVSESGYQKLEDLKKIGFNRVSFGVQDTNQAVQEAIKRRQSLEITKETLFRARELGFDQVNIDLIYGLPLQTRATFRDTIEIIGHELAPDRIALFSYAKVPWMKPHQKAIPDALLPSLEEKFLMYLDARKRLVQEGYTAIGMDHFAHSSDPLSQRFRSKSLQRNFQGYTVLDCRTMISFGITAISDLPQGYFQNTKSLDEYYAIIDESTSLPTQKGILTSYDDHIRRYIINELMCHFELDIQKVEKMWNIDFFSYFSEALPALEWFLENKFASISSERKLLSIAPKGELFVRNIAAAFDVSYQTLKASMKGQNFSKAI